MRHPIRSISRRERAAAVTAALVLAVALAGCGGSPEAGSGSGTETTTTATTTESPAETGTSQPVRRTVTIVVRNGASVGGIQRVSVVEGTKVTLAVTADLADEVHVHGYDLKVDVSPGKTGRIVFDATIPGRFEIELEQRGLQIGELEVRP